jgi:hypothetical protein
MPMRGELPVIATRPYARVSIAAAAWARCLAIVSDRDLQCVAAFCTIGLLLAINMILLVPDYAETVSALQIFP